MLEQDDRLMIHTFNYVIRLTVAMFQNIIIFVDIIKQDGGIENI